MKKIYYIVFLLFMILPLFGQHNHQVKLNHIYLVIPSQDLLAIQKSDFFTHHFSSFETRTTKASNNEFWTATYMYGKDNYFELFDTSSFHSSEAEGIAGIAFSVDKTGELSTLQTHLNNSYNTEISQKARNYDDKEVPWYDALTIIDTTYYKHASVGFWIMEYKKAYFMHNDLHLQDSLLTKESYLSKLSIVNADKILHRFTGLVLQLSQYEIDYLEILFEKLGFEKWGNNKYVSSDNFAFSFNKISPYIKSAVSAIEFESNTNYISKTVKISDNVFVELNGKTGRILFKN